MATTGEDPRRRPSRDVVVFTLEGVRCAVPLDTVERALEVVALSPLPGAPEVFAGVVDLHGSVVPVVDLRRRLELPARSPSLTDHLLVVRSPSRRLALVVNEVVGVSRLPPESMAADVAPLPRGVAGVAALPDGLVFLHDLEALLSAEEERGLERCLEER